MSCILERKHPADENRGLTHVVAGISHVSISAQLGQQFAIPEPRQKMPLMLLHQLLPVVSPGLQWSPA